MQKYQHGSESWLGRSCPNYYNSPLSITGRANAKAAKVPARKDQGGNHLPAAFPPLPLLPVQNLSGRSLPQKVQKSQCTVELVTCKVA